MDHSFTNDNLFLHICHTNLSKGDKIDIVYTGKNQSYFSSVLNFFPQVVSTTNHSDADGDFNCSTIDVDLSSIHALYPGYIHPVIIPQGVSYSHDNYNIDQSYILPKLNQTLNGSYDIGIDISGLSKIYHISVENIYDDQEELILNVNEPYFIVSLLNSSQDVLKEEKLAPSEKMHFHGNFRGGEKIYVNEIDSLEILNYDPCGSINESGYYIFNESATGLNETCVIINNSDDIVLNFGGELIDGDGEENGSGANGTCAIIIENSDKIVIEYLRSQEFFYGICIKNSNVSIYGNYTSSNIHGARVYNNSRVTFYSIYFSNSQSEVISIDNSEVNLTNVSFQRARIKSSINDVKVKTVINSPDPPDIENLSDIDQYIYLINLSSDSTATLGFYYTIPVYNNVSLTNISIFQYPGELELENNTWEEANWTRLYTLVDPQQNLIMTGEVDEIITEFSVFAPFGYPNVTELLVPDPIPDPYPESSPTAGSSPKSGGAIPTEVQLKLIIPKNITLMQGEAGEIKFNVSNIGSIFAPDVRIGPETPNGWDYTNASIGNILVDENAVGYFQIAPHPSTTPRKYNVQVNAYIEKEGKISIATSRLLEVIVIPRKERLKRMKILEYPPVIIAAPGAILNISFLSKNIGGMYLEDIVIKIEESPCINNILGKYNLAVDETSTLTYTFNLTDTKKECDVNLKFYSNEKLVGFVPTRIILREELIPRVDKKTYMVLIYLMWTGLTAFIIGRRRKHKKVKKYV